VTSIPKIYSNERKHEIRERLYDAGLELIRQSGLKGMNIDIITKKVGIAQGTFYNFFPSKEILVFYLVKRYQEQINLKIEDIILKKGCLERSELRIVYHNMMLKDEQNVLRFLKRADIQTLLIRLPDEYKLDFDASETSIEKNLLFIKEKREQIDLYAVMNWIQILNITVENADLLHKDSMDKLIDRLIDNMLDEIYIS
jgi:AcrR family transcriptional regulator